MCRISKYPISLVWQESEAPSVKVAKKTPDDSDETSVKSNRPKCRYWDKCFRKNPDHLKNFRHPAVRRKGSKTKASDENDEEDMDTTETKTVTTRTGRVSKPPQEFKYTKPPAHKNIPQVLLAHKWTERYYNKLCTHNFQWKYHFPSLRLPFMCLAIYKRFYFHSLPAQTLKVGGWVKSLMACELIGMASISFPVWEIHSMLQNGSSRICLMVWSLMGNYLEAEVNSSQQSALWKVDLQTGGRISNFTWVSKTPELGIKI